jgi:hypothetical protein
MDDAGTWGEMLKKYEANKKTRPLPDEAYAMPPRVTSQQKAAEAARYNPVLQTFNDSSMETTAKAREAEMVVRHLNRARDRQIASESTFDILSMRDKGLQKASPSASAPKDRLHVANQELPVFRHPLDSSYAYNIISGLSLAEHSYKPPDARPKVPRPAINHRPLMPHSCPGFLCPKAVTERLHSVCTARRHVGNDQASAAVGRQSAA